MANQETHWKRLDFSAWYYETLPVLCNTVYFLNNSCTKSLVAGLQSRRETSEGKDVLLYKPVVLLKGQDLRGSIAFDLASWNEFQTIFPDIESYLNGKGDQLRDQKVYGTSWTLRYTFSHGSKAIELEDDRRPASTSTGPTVKRTRRSIVLKQVTFNSMNKLSKCVTNYLLYLESMVGSAFILFEQLVELVLNKYRSLHEAQVQVFEAPDLYNALDILCDADVQSVKSECCKIIEEKQKEESVQGFRTLNDGEFTNLFHEILSVHPEEVISGINLKLRE